MTQGLDPSRARPEHLEAAARQFMAGAHPLHLQAYGRGNVNDTFLVTPDRGGEAVFILQRLNRRVFPRPESVMGNLRVLTGHLARRQAPIPLPPGRRWETPKVRLTQAGRDHWLDPEGGFWRALSFIPDAQTVEAIQDCGQAQEAGYALGMFHLLVSDLPPQLLSDTLPGFHITPEYLRGYDAARAASRTRPSPEADFAHRFIAARRDWAGVLEAAKARGELKLRLIHGDPKVNNVMFDRASGQAVSLIDLDTVKPGLLHYDFGDCLRSGCNALGEETRQWLEVRFDADLCRAILQGYLPLARNFLTERDYAYLYDAMRLLAFELGLRFFTDFLAGNVYFKAQGPDHNLWRALVQFRLTESIESQQNALTAMIHEFKGPADI